MIATSLYKDCPKLKADARLFPASGYMHLRWQTKLKDKLVALSVLAGAYQAKLHGNIFNKAHAVVCQ